MLWTVWNRNDADLIPANIKDWVDIFGTTGDFSWWSVSEFNNIAGIMSPLLMRILPSHSGNVDFDWTIHRWYEDANNIYIIVAHTSFNDASSDDVHNAYMQSFIVKINKATLVRTYYQSDPVSFPDIWYDSWPNVSFVVMNDAGTLHFRLVTSWSNWPTTYNYFSFDTSTDLFVYNGVGDDKWMQKVSIWWDRAISTYWEYWSESLIDWKAWFNGSSSPAWATISDINISFWWKIYWSISEKTWDNNSWNGGNYYVYFMKAYLTIT